MNLARWSGPGVAGMPRWVRRPFRGALAMAVGAALLMSPFPAHADRMPGGAGSAETVAMATVSAVDVIQEGVPVDLLAQRSERAYRHVFLAFGVAWLLVLAYALVLGRRLGELERRISHE